VNAVVRLLEPEDDLLGLELSPQPDGPTQKPSLLLDAIVFDHALDACEPIACAAIINWPHAVSVLPIATPSLSTIAQCKAFFESGRMAGLLD
jgi:hypothetical protein